MDVKVEAVLAEYEAREAAESKVMDQLGPAMHSRIDDFLIPVGHDTGTLLNLLAKSAGSKSILEVGTSYGNSTVWLAEAAKVNGGRVTSLELAQKKVDYAKHMLTRAGLEDVVDFVVGDAVATIDGLAGPFDFVLIDLWKDVYIPTFKAVLPKLSQGACVFADNMLYPERSLPDANAYRRFVRSQPDIDTVLIPIGNGVELTRSMRAG
jgi:predicted O-methyltransferase YrrM